MLFVGALYKNPDIYTEFGKRIISKYDFSDEVTKFLYDNFALMYETFSQTINETNINAWMIQDENRLKKYKAYGGYKEIKSWMDLAIEEDVKNYFNTVKKFSLIRAYERQDFPVEQILNLENFEKMTVKDIHEIVKAKLDKIFTVTGEDYFKTYNATTYLQQFIQDIEANKGVKGIPTGFKGLDDILDGGLYAGLYIVGAVSSLGKTTYCLQVGDNIASSGTDVLIFSLEMSRRELISKSLSRLTYKEGSGAEDDTGMKTRQILNGYYTKKNKETINQAINSYKEFSDRVYITEGLGKITTNVIRDSVEKHIRTTNRNPVVILDYIQILAPTDPRMSDKQNIDQAVFELKRLSRDFDIPVLVISSLNRASYNKTVDMSAFKESGALEYSSDVLIGLQFAGTDNKKDNRDAENFINEMKNEYRRKIEVRILKNRNGITGSLINYEFISSFNVFIEGSVVKIPTMTTNQTRTHRMSKEWGGN